MKIKESQPEISPIGLDLLLFAFLERKDYEPSVYGL